MNAREYHLAKAFFHLCEVVGEERAHEIIDALPPAESRTKSAETAIYNRMFMCSERKVKLREIKAWLSGTNLPITFALWNLRNRGIIRRTAPATYELTGVQP